MKRKIDEISIEEIKNAFSICNNNTEVMKMFGYKDNGSGQRFVKKLRIKGGIEQCEYFNYTTRKYYEQQPKKCLLCGKVIPYEKRDNNFCNRSCATTYNNLKKGKLSIETKIKISETLKNNKHLTKEDIESLKNEYEKTCLNCGKPVLKKDFCSNDCKKEYQNKQIIKDLTNGKNIPPMGVSQIPPIVKRFLMEKYDCKCQKCGWGKENPVTHKVPLHVHHIDGDCTNNKIENLQLLCPNCHSLTSNFGSLNKNSKRFHRSKKTLND